MVNKKEIFPIGIGTWNISGENFEYDLNALMHSYERGQNYLSLYMSYNNGKVVKQIKRFIGIIDRDKLFINASLEPTIEKIEDVEKQLNEYLEILDIDFVDSLQMHSPLFAKIPLKDVYKEIERLVNSGKVRYIGISNANLEQLIEINNAVKIDFFEGVYNLECKLYEDIKVLEYCEENDIQFICYQALRRNRTAVRNYPILLEIAKKYNKTQNQIILNRILKEKNVVPLIKSTNIDRINENISSIEFGMSKEDYSKLNQFRSKEFDEIKIDWNGNGGLTIEQLANQFE